MRVHTLRWVVGLGYAIAAHCVYNLPGPEAKSGPKPGQKKIVCLEGDSAFGFSMAEVETMSRFRMDILIFMVNNGGVYHGDSADRDAWMKLQQNALQGKTKDGLRSSSLGWEVGYEKVTKMCGGKGDLVHTPEELAKATEEGFNAKVPVVVNVIIEAGKADKLVRLSSPYCLKSCEYTMWNGLMAKYDSLGLTLEKAIAWMNTSKKPKEAKL